MKKHALIIEEYACWGCKACEAACKQEYNPVHAADSIKYLSVWGDGPKLMNGKLDFMWRVNVCKHCEEPICAKACPEKAISKDPKTGIVLSDNEKCTGCNAGEHERQGDLPRDRGKPRAGDARRFRQGDGSHIQIRSQRAISVQQ